MALKDFEPTIHPNVAYCNFPKPPTDQYDLNIVHDADPEVWMDEEGDTE
jgi:hypothetical protein